LFFIGLAILAIAEVQHAKMTHSGVQAHEEEITSDWRVVGVPLLQHLASALIVAAVMGVSYEYFVHKHVVEGFRELLRDHQKATEQAFDAFRTLTARDVFEFIGNVASHSTRIPTLFVPPRDEVNEIIFSTDISFFQRLIGAESARAEAIEVLAEWLRATALQKRFLASDFVGLLQLKELEPQLRELAAEHQKEWRKLTEAEKGCILNYWWAASRFEQPMYKTLKRYLIEWDDPFVRKWILFVPRQMPDAQLAHLVELFLRTRGSGSAPDVIIEVVAAIETLHHAGINMKQTVVRYKPVFESAALWQEACAAVSTVPPSVQPLRRKRRLLDILRRRGAK
jgi:hypothetical protein